MKAACPNNRALSKFNALALGQPGAGNHRSAIKSEVKSQNRRQRHGQKKELTDHLRAHFDEYENEQISANEGQMRMLYDTALTLAYITAALERQAAALEKIAESLALIAGSKG